MDVNWRLVFDQDVVHRELEIIQNDLHCNAVRICGRYVGRQMTAAEDGLGRALKSAIARDVGQRPGKGALVHNGGRTGSRAAAAGNGRSTSYPAWLRVDAVHATHRFWENDHQRADLPGRCDWNWSGSLSGRCPTGVASTTVDANRERCARFLADRPVATFRVAALSGQGEMASEVRRTL